ncbi:ATP-binding protein [Candidatus Saccharibacteria bacterium]|nr:ATP-binding protein [Candidatus Saccharibacteria bacterium]
MKEVKRDTYLEKLIEARGINLIKVITGIRRCGKSYLLDPIFKNYLINDGVPESHIIHLNLEERINQRFLDPDLLYRYIKGCVHDGGDYYALLDEIQLVPEFESVLNSFLHIDNLDVYVTGSNSRFLSSDIITEFRGRSEEIQMYPLSFSEFFSAYEGDKYQAWTEYMKYGGLPLVLEHRDESSKMEFLINQQKNIYLRDMIDRHHIKNDVALRSLIEIVASSVGSLTNPYKLERAFKSMAGIELSYNTIDDYLKKLEEAFLIEKSERYDVKGKHYIDTPQKYYFSDPGIRNSFVGFRQYEENHIMENIIYNELRRRGYQVDVGVVEVREGDDKKQLEIDFVANRGDRRYYIQSALTLGERDKMIQELRPLKNTDDFFKRIVLTGDLMRPSREQSGIVIMNVLDFLLDEKSLDKEMS